VGYADGSVARHLQSGVSGAVSLEGCAVAVEFPAVELGCELLLGPESVDLEAEHGRVEDRHWKRARAAERREVVLKR